MSHSNCRRYVDFLIFVPSHWSHKTRTNFSHILMTSYHPSLTLKSNRRALEKLVWSELKRVCAVLEDLLLVYHTAAIFSLEGGIILLLAREVKHKSLVDKNQYLNQITSIFRFHNPWNLTLSRGVEMEHWREMS